MSKDIIIKQKNDEGYEELYPKINNNLVNNLMEEFHNGKIVIGNYQGSANTRYMGSGQYISQNINLGFCPKILMITRDPIYSVYPTIIIFGTVKIVRDGYIFAQITDTGFLVGTRASGSETIAPDMNNLSITYHYVAVY